MAIARYTLAVERRQRAQEGQQTADFISCVAFGKNGEFAEKYLKQGTKVAIVGHIQTGSYTNREGQRVYTTDVVIDEQEFAESKNAASGTGSAAKTQHNTQQPPIGPVDENGFMNIPDGVEDEGLPFC